MALHRAALALGLALLAALAAASPAAALNRTTTLVSKPTGVAGTTTADAFFRRTSQDGSRVFFETTQKLTPDDQDTNRQDVYERFGNTTKLVSKPTGVGDPTTGDAVFGRGSPDGSRRLFE